MSIFEKHTDQVGFVKGCQEILIRRAGEYRDQWVNRINPETGELERVKVSLPCGKIEEVCDGNNLALTALKTQLSHLIVGHQTTTRFITKMGWGTGGHIPGDPSQPVAPSVGDPALEAPVLIKPIATFDFPSSTSVLLTAYILEPEANGFTICENGLICGDGRLVARRTFGGLAKTQDWVFQQNWLLAF
jgi:hypothetical protein